MRYLDYNDANVEIVTKLIKEKLSPDLLPKKWIQRNARNSTFGHCHNSAGCLYNVFGPDSLKMYRGLDDEGIYHWWVQDNHNKIIDITSEQYTDEGRIPPYDKGEKSAILGFEYRKRVAKLTRMVVAKLVEMGYNLDLEPEYEYTLEKFFE